jgi:hypothetical protein
MVGTTVAIACSPFYVSISSATGSYGPLPAWVILVRTLCKVWWPTIVLLHSVRFVSEWFGFAIHTQRRPDVAGHLRLVALACVGGLPRFIFYDQMGGVPFSLWFGTALIVADGLLAHILGLGIHQRRWVWVMGAVVVAPWGLFWWMPAWPDSRWGLHG